MVIGFGSVDSTGGLAALPIENGARPKIMRRNAVRILGLDTLRG